ncbi:MAG: hypothetical protein WC979_01155 [Candidatus Pacearchaeota archaeon]|jgi:hypothetical protein|nr:hypothetical protein [Clostridia bacterium]
MKTEIIPVIHMLNQNQVLTNVRTCIECGIKKVFLINHEVTVDELIECALRVKKDYPELWVGVNMLGISTLMALHNDLSVDGLWCDGTVSSLDASLVRNFKGIFFGGLAFKYQPQPKDLKLACEDAKIATDVATTSGVGTGKAADINKVLAIREYLGEHPMAIASGVSLSNIEQYVGIVDYLLVASSITSPGEIIYKAELLKLVNKL